MEATLKYYIGACRPTGPNSFIFAYVTSEKHPHQRLVSPQWEILALQLIRCVFLAQLTAVLLPITLQGVVVSIGIGVGVGIVVDKS